MILRALPGIFKGGFVSTIYKTITFSNPSYTHRVWRSGVPMVGAIQPPTGFTTSWQIINHETRSVVDSGTGNSVSSTLAFASMANCNTYDLLVTVTNGISTFRRIFPGEMTCLPQVPGSYDETWSTASGHGMGWTNRAGYAIRVTGTISGHLNHWWLKSDDPTDPVHVVFDNATINSTSWCFTATASKNVIYDGCTDESVQYGLVANGSGVNQIVQSTFCEPNNATYRGGYTIWCGIKADGAGGGTGVAGFRFIPPNDATNNDTTFTCPGFVLFNCEAVNTWEEGGYFGATNDTLTSGRTYSRTAKALIYGLIFDNTGNEACQMGSIDNFNFFRNRLSNSGTRNQNLHENLYQVAHCTNGNTFMNFFDQGTHNLIAHFQGRTGLGLEFHSNIMLSLGKDGDGAGNFWGRSDNHHTATELAYSIYNNLCRYVAGASFFTLYENTDIWNKFYASGNIIIGATTTDFENGNGMDPAHTVFDNLKYLTANIGTVGFVDHASKDYHLASLASPAFATPTSIPKNSPFADYDYEGVEWVTDVYGAFSGYELMT